LDKYFAALPKVKEAIEACHRQVEQTGEVTSLTGRKRRFQAKVVNDFKFYPGSAYRQAFNFLIQGYSADMIRMAINKVAENRPDNWDLRLIMTVHDEAVYQVKEEYADEAATFIKEMFETAVEMDIPLVADVSVGNNYSEVK
jgi:DNA polymerase-1